jgi:hypothetical protein
MRCTICDSPLTVPYSLREDLCEVCNEEVEKLVSGVVTESEELYGLTSDLEEKENEDPETL